MEEQTNEIYYTNYDKDYKQYDSELEAKKQKALLALEFYNKSLPKEAKVLLYIGGGLILLWSSGYIFSALASAVRGFKDLRTSIREK